MNYFNRVSWLSPFAGVALLAASLVAYANPDIVKKDIEKKEMVVSNTKISYEDQKKGKSLQNRLSKIKNQIKNLSER